MIFYNSVKNTKLVQRQEILPTLQCLVKTGMEQRSHPSGNIFLIRQVTREVARVMALLCQKGQKVSQCLLEVVMEAGFLKSRCFTQ